MCCAQKFCDRNAVVNQSLSRMETSNGKYETDTAILNKQIRSYIWSNGTGGFIRLFLWNSNEQIIKLHSCKYISTSFNSWNVHSLAHTYKEQRIFHSRIIHCKIFRRRISLEMEQKWCTTSKPTSQIKNKHQSIGLDWIRIVDIARWKRIPSPKVVRKYHAKCITVACYSWGQ